MEVSYREDLLDAVNLVPDWRLVTRNSATVELGGAALCGEHAASSLKEEPTGIGLELYEVASRVSMFENC